jgi:plastocyanin
VPGGAGILRGTVRLGEKLSTRRIRFTHYPDLTVASPTRRPAPVPAEIQNVVVSLVPLDGTAAPVAPGKVYRMEQVQETFVPHVLPVPVGSTVEFVNGDPIFHNVFSLSRAASFDLGRFPRGDSRSVRFDRPGSVKVYCHIHSDMSASILVLDTPYFTVPDARGGFELPRLPSGRYTATAWHERAHPIRREVRIEAGAVTETDFSIPLEETVVDE